MKYIKGHLVPVHSNEKYKKAIYIFSSTYGFSMTISKLECCDLVSTWHVQVDKCLEYT